MCCLIFFEVGYVAKSMQLIKFCGWRITKVRRFFLTLKRFECYWY